MWLFWLALGFVLGIGFTIWRLASTE